MAKLQPLFAFCKSLERKAWPHLSSSPVLSPSGLVNIQNSWENHYSVSAHDDWLVFIVGPRSSNQPAEKRISEPRGDAIVGHHPSSKTALQLTFQGSIDSRQTCPISSKGIYFGTASSLVFFMAVWPFSGLRTAPISPPVQVPSSNPVPCCQDALIHGDTAVKPRDPARVRCFWHGTSPRSVGPARPERFLATERSHERHTSARGKRGSFQRFDVRHPIP